VNRDTALESLPPGYATAIRLRDAGRGSTEIALELRIAPEAVKSTLELADAKLARLLRLPEPEGEHEPETETEPRPQ
jgi:DNA-directed RNA polymerase specialized sigma24 family protein